MRPHATSSKSYAEAGRQFTARTWLWVPVLVAGFANALFAGSFLILGPVVADSELGGAASWGLITAALAAGSVVGGLVMLRWQPSRPLLVGLPAFALLAPGLALLALAAPLPLVMAAFFVGGIGSEICGTLWDTAVQENIPRDQLSRVSAYDHLGSLVAVPIGLSTIGPIADDIGIEEALWASSVLLAVAILSQLLIRDVRELRRGPS